MLNICYCGAQAGYAHDDDCPYPLFRAGDSEASRWERANGLLKAAREAGEAHGRAAASWYFDGNTTTETYRHTLEGLEAGDPAVLDTFPCAPLSGEWADEPTPATVLEGLGADDDDDERYGLVDAYEQGFARAAYCEIERVARYQLEGLENEAANV